MKYLLDANTYIQAKNLHYRMSFCPAYWDWHDQQFLTGILGSIDLVLDELKKGNDELADWASARTDHFVSVDDNETQEAFTEIAEFIATHNVWQEPHISGFLSVADPWLIAKAISTDAIVVTHEILVPDNSTKVKIPNVCKAFDVTYLNTYQLLDELKAQFILEL